MNDPIIPSILIVDDFCPVIDQVRQSALESGFGTWQPNKGEVGSSIYEGMNFWGRHSFMLHSLALAVGRPVFPNSMFFRVTGKNTEKAYIHSDREMGSYTCVAYLSDHKAEISGTAFYRHRKSGLRAMPTIAEMRKTGLLKRLKPEMVSGLTKDWEQLDFVRGLYNRALIFHAPLFHSRWPKDGIGTTNEEGRMVWVCHFEIA